MVYSNDDIFGLVLHTKSATDEMYKRHLYNISFAEALTC